MKRFAIFAFGVALLSVEMTKGEADAQDFLGMSCSELLTLDTREMDERDKAFVEYQKDRCMRAYARETGAQGLMGEYADTSGEIPKVLPYSEIFGGLGGSAADSGGGGGGGGGGDGGWN